MMVKTQEFLKYNSIIITFPAILLREEVWEFFDKMSILTNDR